MLVGFALLESTVTPSKCTHLVHCMNDLPLVDIGHYWLQPSPSQQLQESQVLPSITEAMFGLPGTVIRIPTQFVPSVEASIALITNFH